MVDLAFSRSTLSYNYATLVVLFVASALMYLATLKSTQTHGAV